jgi:hypothetical protein
MLYQNPGFNEGELISTYFDVEFLLSDYFFIGGDTEIFFHPDRSYSFTLNSAYYNFNLGFRIPIDDGSLTLEYNHMCIHPIVTYIPLKPTTEFYFEGTADRITLTFSNR